MFGLFARAATEKGKNSFAPLHKSEHEQIDGLISPQQQQAMHSCRASRGHTQQAHGGGGAKNPCGPPDSSTPAAAGASGPEKPAGPANAAAPVKDNGKNADSDDEDDDTDDSN
jgi:hypothetical protein